MTSPDYSPFIDVLERAVNAPTPELYAQIESMLRTGSAGSFMWVSGSPAERIMRCIQQLNFVTPLSDPYAWYRAWRGAIEGLVQGGASSDFNLIGEEAWEFLFLEYEGIVIGLNAAFLHEDALAQEQCAQKSSMRGALCIKLLERWTNNPTVLLPMLDLAQIPVGDQYETRQHSTYYCWLGRSPGGDVSAWILQKLLPSYEHEVNVATSLFTTHSERVSCLAQMLCTVTAEQVLPGLIQP